ncbi:MAG: tRNA (adenosine(37)-N6)-threonylcarbamoyltransferase complex ATPase subunit type 1 TsaE [Chloroflexi bacterium]|nr:MAG: tRNA (adenosine(37)-N6)-threonylcarbamoyltransferase complex ATPase subunit type 1 TsaE [Chloroflexota bacterium]
MTTNPARLAEKVGPAVAWETTSAAETHALGKAVGEACAGHAVMALVGPRGAGKTCLVRGIAEGLGVPTDLVASPTFVLIHEYAGRLPLYHADLYRLEEQDAVNGLGLEEYTESPGVTVIDLGGDRRRVALHPRGARSAELVARATARLAKQSPTGRA